MLVRNRSYLLDNQSRKEGKKEYTRLAVTPPGRVPRSVDGRLRPKEAIQATLASGIPQECLNRFDISIRHTHARINAVVLELPSHFAPGLEAYLQENGLMYERISTVATCSACQRQDRGSSLHPVNRFGTAEGRK
jgi:hypothetical protein